ncbi:hypothetical protein [Gordonia sihwensis]|uniref:hypothetical protein n=1 Tax=Gordonia sihwensis TaxID=173559 RepID=UPI0012E04060|nr:hypothetical protein [Gordonia sihwensis]
MSRTDRQHDRDRLVITILLGALAALWAIGFSLFFWGNAGNGLLLVGVAAAIATGAAFVYATRGAAAVRVVGLGSAAITAWVGWVGGLNWGLFIGGAVLTVLLVLGAVAGRTRRLPRLLAGSVAAVITPTTFLLSKLVGGWVLLIAAALGAGFVAWQINLPRRAAAREASRRSSIPMLGTGLFSLSSLGVDPPTGVDQQTLIERVEADQATARALDELPTGWFTFHSRQAYTGDIIDHVVVGPPGVIALRSERFPGHLRLDVANVSDAGVPVTMDDAETGLVVSQVLCETAAAIDLHLLTPNRRRVTRAVLVAHDGTLDGPTLTQPVTADGVADTVTWVTPATLVDYLLTLPSAGLDRQFVEDLATVVDFQLQPAE